MPTFKILCEERDFSALAEQFAKVCEGCDSLSAEIVFVGEDEIRRLNRETRGVDSVTDVLSFPSLENHRGKIIKAADYPADSDGEGGVFLGSIAICTQRAAMQAAEYGHSEEREINYLATHGLFHLLGYDHIEESDKAEMREKEEGVLSALKLTRD